MTELEQQLLSALEQLQIESERERQALRASFEADHNSLVSVVERLAGRLESADEANAALSQRVSALHQQLSGLVGQLQSWNEEAQGLNRRVESLSEQVTHLARNANADSRAWDNSTRELKRLQQALSELLSSESRRE